MRQKVTPTDIMEITKLTGGSAFFTKLLQNAQKEGVPAEMDGVELPG
jgi:hypothetical protein